MTYFHPERYILEAIINLFHSLKPYHRLLVAITVLSSLILAPMQRSASAAGPECSSSSPVSAVYMVTVCIIAPMDGAVLSGNTTVTATVDVVGTNPGIQKLIFYLGGQYLLTDYALHIHVHHSHNKVRGWQPDSGSGSAHARTGLVPARLDQCYIQQWHHRAAGKYQ